MKIPLWLQQLASAVRRPTFIYHFFWCALVCGVVPASPADGATSGRRVPDEQRLYESIMRTYQQSVMPHTNSSQPLAVAFSLRLNQIVSLNERKQVLTTNVFIDQAWTDPRLRWDPKKFSDVRALRIPADHVWLPDTFVYNNADGGNSGFMRGTYVQIQSNGRVLWPVPLRLLSSCSVHITYFPFDSQVCLLRFGSWTYGLSKLDYTALTDGLTVDPSSYINNSEWELVSITMSRAILHPSAAGGLGLLGPHPYLSYALHLQRNTFFYLFNIIVPCVMLSTLNVLTFWLPPLSGEKVTLGLSVFLAFSMFMLLIAEEVPASSEAVPIIGVYLCMVMTMTSLSVIMAVVVTNLYHRGLKMRPAPRWLAALCLQWMARPLCVSNDIPLLAAAVDLAEHCQYNMQQRKMSQPPSQDTRPRHTPRGSLGLSHDTHFIDLPDQSPRENLPNNPCSNNSLPSSHCQNTPPDGRCENQPPYSCSDNFLPDANCETLAAVRWYVQNGDVTLRETEDIHGCGSQRSRGVLSSPQLGPDPLSFSRRVSLAGGGCERRAARELHPRARDSVTRSHRFLPAQTLRDEDEEEKSVEEDEARQVDDEDEQDVWVLRARDFPSSPPSRQDRPADEEEEEEEEEEDRVERCKQNESTRRLLSERSSSQFSSSDWSECAGVRGMRRHDVLSWTRRLDSAAASLSFTKERGEPLMLRASSQGRDFTRPNPEATFMEENPSLDVQRPSSGRQKSRRSDTDCPSSHENWRDVSVDAIRRDSGAIDPLLAKGGKKLDPHPTSSDLQAVRTLVAEWQQIATVVDRVMFIVYLLSTVIAYIVILLMLPASQPPLLAADNSTQVGEMDFQFKRYDR